MIIKKHKLKINQFGGNNKFTEKQIEQFMKDGGNTGKLYQLAIINKNGWKDMTEFFGSNALYDSERIDESGFVIKQEIRTLSKNGICWYQAMYMGSKADNNTKLKSTHKKLKTLEDSGEFVLYDNTKWSLKNPYIMVYTINIKDWKYAFGKHTFQTSYKDMIALIKNYSS
jgi:hypothetical protein